MATHLKGAAPHMKGKHRKTAACDVHRTLRLPQHLDAEIARQAARYLTSKADLIRRCIAHGLKVLRDKEKTNAE